MNESAGPRPLDQIDIRELRFRCIIGVNGDERREKQDVVAHVTIYADLRKACESDNIEDSVDYKVIKRQIIAMAEKSDFRLIEALAQAIADICLEHHRVQRARVVVEKPGALRFAKTVGVQIVRSKQEPTE